MPPLSDFIPLGPRISLYTPANPTRGQLIILCTWLGAAPKHIAKYTTVYNGIAPSARILLIESGVPILVSSYARQRAAIVPAVLAVLDTLSECADNKLAPKILLHMFSNGGTNTATQFLFVLNQRLRAPLPLTGMLYDSCPAKGTYWKDHKAMVYSLPKDVVSRTLGNVVVHIILLMLHTEMACGLENPSSLLRRTLLDENKVAGTSELGNGPEDDAGKGPGRACYLYSKSDQMVDWTDVRDHAEEAKGKGWEVEEVLFEGSSHCGHFQKDEGLYVKAMEKMWQADPVGQEATKGVSKL
ncbi:hypothetical protein N7G274_005423 [Stereocaulon virgatum]|uniref:DUF829-domain-containing protein n=1 Tax=Stereocaulon virgatum TaxID=373712 RepID=A0ABR4A6U9_9LECA